MDKAWREPSMTATDRIAPSHDPGEMRHAPVSDAIFGFPRQFDREQARSTTLTDRSARKQWGEARDAPYLAAVVSACYAADNEQAIFQSLASYTADWADSAGVATFAGECSELVAFASRTTDADNLVAALFAACVMGGAHGLTTQTEPRVYRLREVPLGGATTPQRHHTLACVPIVIEGEVIATLYAAASTASASLDDISLMALTSVATHAARAIAKARVHHDLTTRLAALEAANRHKDDFLATVSHELRTPLTAILGFAHIIVENDALGAVRRRGMAEDIVASGGLLLTQVNDLLDIVQLGAGRLAVSMETVDLIAVIHWCERAVQSLMKSKRLQFALAIPPDLPPARANAARLQQVLLNFLVNAYKFTPAGGTVTLTAETSDGNVAITVRDTGIGIAPEDAARIFEPFARVETDYTRTQSGAGVGLAVARQLVDLMGGTIVLDSTPAVGSTFTVMLKAAT